MVVKTNSAVGQLLTCGGIDDLGDHVILVDVHAVLLQALEGHARAGDLGQAINIARVDAQQLLDALAHLLGPGLRAEAARLQLQILLRIDSHLPDGLAQVGGVGGRTAQKRGTQVLHHQDLALSVAAGHGNDHRPDAVRTLIRAKSAGEQAQAIGDLHDVILSGAGGGQRAGHHLAPNVDVVAGVSGHDGLARGAGGTLNAHDLALRRSQQVEGVIVPQVGLFHEGQVLQILEAADVLRLHPCGVHPRPVHGHIFILPLHGGSEALALQGRQLVAADTFHGRIVDPVDSLAHINHTFRSISSW